MFALPPPASSLISPARPPAREQFFSPAINQSIIRARVNTSLANNITATLGLLSERKREGERGWQIDFLHLPRYFFAENSPYELRAAHAQAICCIRIFFKFHLSLLVLLSSIWHDPNKRGIMLRVNRFWWNLVFKLNPLKIFVTQNLRHIVPTLPFLQGLKVL